MSSQIANGKPVTVYLAACNDAGLCSSFAGPTAQVTPYQPIATPTVTATAERHVDHLHLERDERRPDRDAERLHQLRLHQLHRPGRPAGTAARPPTATATANRDDHRLPHRHRGPARTRHGHRLRAPRRRPRRSPPCRSAGRPTTDQQVRRQQLLHSSRHGFTANSVTNYTCVLTEVLRRRQQGGTLSPRQPGAAHETNGSGGASFEADCVHAPDGADAVTHSTVG